MIDLYTWPTPNGMGAEVIQLEWRKGGDLRNSGPFVGDMSVQFAAYNRGKKSITLNTRHPRGQEILWQPPGHQRNGFGGVGARGGSDLIV